jgi:rhamnose transport system permease protein
MGLSGIIVGQIFIAWPMIPIPLAFLIGLVIGALLGSINGVITAFLKLPSIIVTIATLNIFRAFVFVVSQGKQINSYQIPEALIKLSQDTFLYVPWIVIISLVIAAITAVFLKYSHTGREIYAIGNNLNAAKLRGINEKKVLTIIFAISGALAGFAGVMYASRYGYVNPSKTGSGFEFVVIAATIIGGASASGGSGTVLGTILGCLLLGVVNTALAVLGISEFWQQAMYGLIIVAALAMDRMIQDRVFNSIKRGKLI